MRFLPLLLLAMPTTAVARDADDSDLADFFTHAGDIEGLDEGPVALPLYACLNNGRVSCIEATLEDGKRYLFEVVPGFGGIVLSPAFTSAAGLELKDEVIAKGPRLKGHLKREKVEFGVADLESLDLGGVVLRDLKVFSPEPGPDYKQDLDEDPNTDRMGGIIGLNHFPELSWALLRSEGVLKLSQSESLLSQVNAEPLQSRYIPATFVNYGEVLFVNLNSVPILVDGQVNGQTVPIALGLGSGTTVARAQVADRPHDFAIGGYEFHTLPVEVGSLKFNAAAVEVGYGLFELDLGLELGSDYLWPTDWAYDPASEQVALAWVSKDGRSSWTSSLLEELQAGLTPEADPETGEEPPPLEGKALAKLQTGIANGLYHKGNPDEELEALRLAVEATPESCAAHHNLGGELLDYGRPVEALASLQRAAELWDAWDQLDPWEKDAWSLWIEDLDEGLLNAALKRNLKHAAKLQWRQNIEEGLQVYWVGSQMVEREAAELPAIVQIQHNSCGSVWGSLAGAHAATGDLEAVNAIYAERLDYDGTVALVAGNARLAAGDFAGANEAYQQAVKLGEISGRFGAALIQIQAGESEAGIANMSDLTWANDDIDWLRRYFLTIADLQGPDAAADEMARRAALWPENATLRLAAAEAGLNAGRDASGWVQGSLQAFEYRLLGPMYRGEDRAQYATALFLDGQVDEARNQAEQVLEKDPAHSTALTTLGLIAALEGDTEGAKEMMDRARVADVYDPAYAVTGSN